MRGSARSNRRPQNVGTFLYAPFQETLPLGRDWGFFTEYVLQFGPTLPLTVLDMPALAFGISKRSGTVVSDHVIPALAVVVRNPFFVLCFDTDCRCWKYASAAKSLAWRVTCHVLHVACLASTPTRCSTPHIYIQSRSGHSALVPPVAGLGFIVLVFSSRSPWSPGSLPSSRLSS
jgi:hypothetical protein